MKRTAIATDSNSGITQSESKEIGVFVLPMPFLIDGDLFYEDISLSQEEFYEKLCSDVTVSTSQPSLGELSTFWDEILKEYDEILYIPMSSGLSQSCDAAENLSKEYKGKVFVVDNQRISVTQKQSVYDAVTLLKKGKTAKEIKEDLLKTKMDSSIYIMLDTLKYLKKGGRITPAAAAVGSMLKLKPVLQIQGEKLDKFCMSTRSLIKAKEAMIKGIVSDFNGRFKELVSKGEMGIAVAHTQNLTEAEKFKEEIENLFPDIPFIGVDSLSLSISCHIGPGSLAIACARIVK